MKYQRAGRNGAEAGDRYDAGSSEAVWNSDCNCIP